MFLCVLASAAHASSLDGNYAEQAQRRLSYERVYTFHAGPVSWFNAREDCATIGGDLATARSEAENDKIYDLRGELDAWIGLSDIPKWSPDTEGSFGWQEDKSPVTYANWAPYEPSQTDKENCVLILENKTWSDSDCGKDFIDGEGSPFICQVDVTYAPTYTPMPSREPTPAPSQSPVPESTVKPNPAPTQSPVPEPTVKPNPAPTQSPVPEPTVKPIPAPTQTPVPTQPPPGTCFHGDGTVLLESGASTRFSELTLGERIKTSDGRGGFSFNPVLSLPHKNNTEPALFLTLTTETGKQLDMTSDHYIPKCEENHLRFGVSAGELGVGDCLLTADGKETLIEISSSTKNGVFTAITEAKYIVVDGVVASSFSKDSDPNKPELDYEKYLLELERKRERRLNKHVRGRLH